jgi:hypothetical protein
MTNAANCFAAFALACLPAAYEVSCRVRTGSPRGLWPHSPRTVASRRFGSPVPRRRGLGGKTATIQRRSECTRVGGDVKQPELGLVVGCRLSVGGERERDEHDQES